MIDYDEHVWSELAMKVLDGDVKFLASRYNIPGYDYDDLCQELRLRLWQKVHLYDPQKSGIRAWANVVMRNHIKNLFRDINTQKRSAIVVPICDEFSLYFEKDVECQRELEDLLSTLHELNMTLDDIS